MATRGGEGNGWLAAGAAFVALGIIAGAFGAHVLSGRLSSGALALWHTAARYWMYGSFGLALIGLAARGGRSFTASAWLLFVGVVVFSGTVGAIALGAPHWLGAVTPLGGLAMIAGFLLFAWTALRS